MLPELLATARIYATSEHMLTRLVGDFTPEDWLARDPVGHTPLWVVGHLATYRKKVAAMVGAPQPEAPWEAAFLKGTAPADVPADLDVQAVLASFRASHAAILGRWEALTAVAMAEPYGRTLPDGTDTIGGAIGFMAWHETYHLGQLGLLRRLAGKPGAA